MLRALFNTGNTALDCTLEGRPVVDEVFDVIVRSHLGLVNPLEDPYDLYLPCAKIVPFVIWGHDPSFVIEPVEELHREWMKHEPFTATIRKYLGEDKRPHYAVEEDGKTLIQNLGRYTSALFGVIILAGDNASGLLRS